MVEPVIHLQDWPLGRARGLDPEADGFVCEESVAPAEQSPFPAGRGALRPVGHTPRGPSTFSFPWHGGLSPSWVLREGLFLLGLEPGWGVLLGLSLLPGGRPHSGRRLGPGTRPPGAAAGVPAGSHLRLSSQPWAFPPGGQRWRAGREEAMGRLSRSPAVGRAQPWAPTGWALGTLLGRS